MYTFKSIILSSTSESPVQDSKKSCVVNIKTHHSTFLVPIEKEEPTCNLPEKSYCELGLSHFLQDPINHCEGCCEMDEY